MAAKLWKKSSRRNPPRQRRERARAEFITGACGSEQDWWKGAVSSTLRSSTTSSKKRGRCPASASAPWTMLRATRALGLLLAASAKELSVDIGAIEIVGGGSPAGITRFQRLFA